ncbi:CoA transferase [Microbacterium sp. NPDC056044]|uniref:CaiB/BaiF CoA-transferase family protein n=1 Tax=Microbacterium sp. NPDC056044 TaxID=3345690 RepID=UPI0035D8319D
MTDGAARALEGVRVLEVGSDLAASWCARLLAGFGADVVRVDLVTDTAEPHAASGDHAAGIAARARRLHADAGKRSVRIDARQARDRERLRRLQEAADLVVTAAVGAEAQTLGVEPREFAARCPGVPLVAITPFGVTGLRAGEAATDPTLMAMAGWMSVQGASDGPPVGAGGDYVAHLSGAAGALGAVAALLVAEAGGGGQLVEVRAIDVALGSTMFDATGYAGTGRLRPRRTTEPGQSWAVFATADGHVSVSSSAARAWVSLWAVVFGEQAVGDRLARDGQPSDAEDLERLAALIATREKRELMELAQLLGHLVGEVASLYDVLELPQLTQRDWFVDIPTCERGDRLVLRAAGAPVRIPHLPWAGGGVAPAPGAHDDAVDAEWQDGSRPAPTATPALLTAASLPFAGLRVVDLTAGWAGPYTTQLLADLGAEVVKVESVGRTDWVRTARRFFTGPDDVVEHLWETSPMFNGVNEGKLGVTLDLTDAECRGILLRLVESADVLVENFTPRVMRNLGLTDEVLRAARHDLVIVSMPGMGREGPWSDFRATALVTEAVAGVTSRCGYPDGVPQVVAQQHADPNAGLVGAFATALALRHRMLTGQGGCIEVAQLEALVTHVGAELLATQLLGAVPPRRGSGVLGAQPSGCFAAAGDDEWIVLSAMDDAEWVALAGILGGAAPAWTDAEARAAHAEEVTAWAAARCAERDAAATAAELRAAGVPAARVASAADVLSDPLLADAFHVVEREWVGSWPYPSSPLRLSRTPCAPRTAAPTLGQHNARVLGGLLGVSAEALDAWEEKGLIGNRPRSL